MVRTIRSVGTGFIRALASAGSFNSGVVDDELKARFVFGAVVGIGGHFDQDGPGVSEFHRIAAKVQKDLFPVALARTHAIQSFVGCSVLILQQKRNEAIGNDIHLPMNFAGFQIDEDLGDAR